ncbi:BRO1-like domain [Carpediemonas membranifera]|uniref:BRO1-like domain n=1 Tax=Carpediemonas membranifera TaxID=201153 RepID=A0A8J6E1D0_9EUKA|nr:BRO1-like domain [Carpediemonas membranifera]|eukprot:KAG9390472.1 BRO1-like domain [Carpediemonas membranifera]
MFRCFKTPHTKGLDIYAVMKDVVTITTDVKSKLNNATQAENDLVSYCDKKNATTADIIHAIDAVTPHIHTLYTELNRLSQGRPYMIKKLQFEWRSPSRGDKNFIKMHGLNYELLMLITSKATMMLNQSAESYEVAQTASDKQKHFTEAVKLCKEAAGLITYARDTLLPSWSADEIPSDSHPELLTEFLDLLHSYAIGSARMIASETLIAAREAILAKPVEGYEIPEEDRNALQVKAEVIAGLSRDASVKLTTAISMFSNSKISKNVDKDIKKALEWLVSMLEVRELQFMAESEFYTSKPDSTEQYGRAVAYMDKARRLCNTWGGKVTDKAGGKVATAVKKAMVEKVTQRLEQMQFDNLMVYHEPVPEFSTLKRAEALAQIGEKPYEPGAPLYTDLELKKGGKMHVEK